MKTKLYYLLLAIVAVLMSGCKSSTEDLRTELSLLKQIQWEKDSIKPLRTLWIWQIR